LTEIGYDTRIYAITFSGGDDIAEAARLIGSSDVRVIYREPSKMLRMLEDRVFKGRFQRLKRLMMYKQLYPTARGESDILIDTGTNMPTKTDAVYIHYPAIADPDIPEDEKRLAWRLYDVGVRIYAWRLRGDPRIAMTNSTWTLRKFLEFYHSYSRDAEVLHPPIDDIFFSYSGSKDRVAVTLSRFSPEKRLHEIPLIASEMPDFKFYIVGSCPSQIKNLCSSVIERVREAVEIARAGNVEIVVNASRERVAELLGSASLYIHPMFREHFGIAVAEAAASGAIPIVYFDGGSCTDIASRISPSLCYRELSEVPKIARSIWSDREDLGRRAREIARGFRYEEFKKKLESIIDRYVLRRS
jgi:glycosyltransferase involved in cell wall biosynthesis